MARDAAAEHGVVMQLEGSHGKERDHIRAGIIMCAIVKIVVSAAYAFLLAPAGALAGPLEIPPGPMLWEMPYKNDYVGVADFLADRDLGLCSSCDTCEFEAVSAVFASPGPLGRISGCGIVVQDSLVEITRLETIHLENVGTSTTIAASMRSIVFSRGAVIVQPIFACEGTHITSLRLLAAAGTMTIRRSSETGGSFDLRFNVIVDLTLQRGWPPSTLTARLGPYSVAMESVRWTYRTGSASICESCVGSFSIELSGIRERFVLSGSGTSAQLSDPFHLDQSWFSMPLYPICAVREMAVHGASWGAIKNLFR